MFLWYIVSEFPEIMYESNVKTWNVLRIYIHNCSKLKGKDAGLQCHDIATHKQYPCMALHDQYPTLSLKAQVLWGNVADHMSTHWQQRPWGQGYHTTLSPPVFVLRPQWTLPLCDCYCRRREILCRNWLICERDSTGKGWRQFCPF